VAQPRGRRINDHRATDGIAPFLATDNPEESHRLSRSAQHPHTDGFGRRVGQCRRHSVGEQDLSGRACP